MNLYMIKVQSPWSEDADFEATLDRLAMVDPQMAHRVVWIRTYILTNAEGRLGAMCIYKATSQAALAEHADCAGMAGATIAPIRAQVSQSRETDPPRVAA